MTASNRAAMIYRLPGCRESVRLLAERLDGEPAVDVSVFLEDGKPVARRGGVDVPLAELGHPAAEARVRAALRNPNAGEVLISAAQGFEFRDLGGGHHSGGGSHGSLAAGDSEVPIVTVGIDGEPRSIVDVAPLILEHFRVERPVYAERTVRAA